MDLKDDLIKLNNGSISDVLKDFESQIKELETRRFIFGYLFLQEEIEAIKEVNDLPKANIEIELSEAPDGSYLYLEAKVYHPGFNDLPYTKQEMLSGFEGKLAYAVSRINTNELNFFGEIENDSVVIPLDKTTNTDISNWILSKELLSTLEQNKLELSLNQNEKPNKRMKI